MGSQLGQVNGAFCDVVVSTFTGHEELGERRCVQLDFPAASENTYFQFSRSDVVEFHKLLGAWLEQTSAEHRGMKQRGVRSIEKQIARVVDSAERLAMLHANPTLEPEIRGAEFQKLRTFLERHMFALVGDAIEAAVEKALQKADS